MLQNDPDSLSSMSYSLEACVTSFDEAIYATSRGAHRLEICQWLETGGMTPEFDLVNKICTEVNIPVRVMIRARPEGFECDQQSIEEMISSIIRFSQLPINGFVLGLLKKNRIDKLAMTRLMENMKTHRITVHKAIDLSGNLEEDVRWINDQFRIDTILTSGGKEYARDGIIEILKIKNMFKREVMAAGKITQSTISGLHGQLQLGWYHGQKIV